VQGDPGQLWGDLPTPWVAGCENAQRWIGRAGPRAQEAYFGRHRGGRIGWRFAGVAAAAACIVGGIAFALR
jgi:hypothetical protein